MHSKEAVENTVSPPPEHVRPFGLTRCTAPRLTSSYDVSGISYDPQTQMSVRDGRILVEEPILDSGVQCTVTTTEDMQSWTDHITDN